MENLTVKELATLYRDYLNNFLTIGCFADYHGFSDDDALSIVRIGRIVHECGF